MQCKTRNNTMLWRLYLFIIWVRPYILLKPLCNAGKRYTNHTTSTKLLGIPFNIQLYGLSLGVGNRARLGIEVLCGT
jgi:hypothetical protein